MEIKQGQSISHSAVSDVTTAHALGSTARMMPGVQILETGARHMGVNLGG